MRLALLCAFLLVGGCVAQPDHEVAGTEEVHTGEDIVFRAGRLEVPQGAVYELRGGSLRMHDDPEITVDGIVEVRGSFVAKDATISNLFRLVVHPGATLRLDNVRILPATIPAALDLRSPDVRISGGDLAVRTIDVRAAATITGARITGDTTYPVVYWHDAAVTFTDNVVVAPGYGVVLDRASGTVRGNTVTAGDGPGETAIAVRGGSVQVTGNTVSGAVGIGLDGASGEVLENVVRNATQAGIALVASKAAVTGNDVSDSGRAGIYLKGATSEVRVSGNTVTRTGDGTATQLFDYGAGIAVDGGAPLLENNDVSENDVGIAVLAGTPTAHGNNLERNRHAGAALANATQVDFTLNWWGLPTGPLPATTGTPVPEVPSPAGADRVDPRILYEPWLPARRERATSESSSEGPA